MLLKKRVKERKSKEAPNGGKEKVKEAEKSRVKFGIEKEAAFCMIVMIAVLYYDYASPKFPKRTALLKSRPLKIYG